MVVVEVIGRELNMCKQEGLCARSGDERQGRVATAAQKRECNDSSRVAEEQGTAGESETRSVFFQLVAELVRCGGKFATRRRPRATGD